MRPAAPAIQTAASHAERRSVSPSLEAVGLALSLGGGMIGTLALVYYGASTDYKPPFAILCAAAVLIYAAAIRRRFGALAAWAAALTLNVTWLCSGVLRGGTLLSPLALGLAAPAAAYALCRAFRLRSSFFAWAVLACLAVDLWSYARSNSLLYEGQPSPASRGVDVALAPPRWPASRSPAPPEWISEDAQAVRYPELVLRQAFALAPPMTHGFYTIESLRNYERSGARPPAAAPSFEQALRGRRWATFLLGKHYFQLIHSGLPPGTIAALMAVDQPLFQFKDGAVVMPDERLPGFLAALPADAAGALLRCYAVLAEDDGGAWNGLVVSPKDALDRSRSCRPPAFRLSIERQSDDSVEGSYEAAKAGALYWSDGYDERWRAFIDGSRAPIARAGVAFKALPLPAGTHRLRLDYEPRAFQIGLLLHFAALAACALGALATGWWSRASRSR